MIDEVIVLAFQCAQSLLGSDSTLASDPNVRVFMSFDNEEVGSNSNRGAGSRMALSGEAHTLVLPWLFA